MVVKVKEPSQTNYFTHGWSKNCWIHTILNGIRTMENASSFVQNLSSCRRYTMLNITPLVCLWDKHLHTVGFTYSSQNIHKIIYEKFIYIYIKVGELHRGVEEGATPFSGLLHFTYDMYLILLSIKRSGIKLHVLVSRAIDEHPTLSLSIYIYIYACLIK